MTTTVERLGNMAASTYALYVREHLFDDGAWEDTLLDPRLAPRTHAALKSLHVDLDGQLGARRARLDSIKTGGAPSPAYRRAKAEHDEWRARALGYKSAVSKRLADAADAVARAHRNRGPAAPVINKTADNVRALFALAYAVLMHREACDAEGIRPEPHDFNLWAKLDELTHYAGSIGEQPLIDWLDYAMSKPDWVPPGDRPALRSVDL